MMRRVCWDWPGWRWSVSCSPRLGVKIVQLVTDDPDAARCPACRVVSTSGKDWVLTRPHDLPCGGGQFAVCSGASGAGGAARRTVRGRRSPSRSPRCRPGCAPRPGCGPRSRWRSRTAGISPRSPPRTGCRGRRCSARWSPAARSSCVEPEPARVLGMDETRFGRPRWLPDGVTMTTAGSGGGARIRGRPGSSTSPVIRPCWGRSTAGPAPRCRPGWPPAPRRSGPGSRWW